MKLSLGDFLVPALLVGAVGWWGYTTWTARAEKSQAELVHQAESAGYQRAVAGMAARHAATPALTDKLAQSQRLYTYNVQNALLAGTGRAVIVNAVIVDLAKRDGGFLLRLDDAGTTAPAISYFLECDAATAQKIVGLRGPAPGVTVVAEIAVVEKAEDESAAAKPGEALSAARYLAKGRCLELVVREAAAPSKAD